MKSIMFDPVKYSIFDVIEYLKSIDIEVDFVKPETWNNECIEWYKKEFGVDVTKISPDSDDYSPRRCKSTDGYVYISNNFGFEIHFPHFFKMFDLNFLDNYILFNIPNDYKDISEEESNKLEKEQKEIWKKLNQKFSVKKNNFIKKAIPKDIEKIIKLIEDNDATLDRDGNEHWQYIALKNMRDMNILEQKEAEEMIEKNIEYREQEKGFLDYAEHKFEKGRDWKNISWTPTYPNWEEDIKKYPELDPRKNEENQENSEKKKGFFKNIFSKD